MNFVTLQNFNTKNMKTLFTSMRNTSFLLLTFIAFISVAATLIKVDFTGDWVLDTAKSNLGERGGRMAASKLKVTQDAT